MSISCDYDSLSYLTQVSLRSLIMSFQPEFRRVVSSILAGSLESSEYQRTVTREGFVDFLQQEGLSPLLHYQLARLDGPSSVPNELRLHLRKAYFGQFFVEDLRQERSRMIFHSIQARGIPCLALKGSALAYSIYPEPSLRVRGDTDLFIRTRDRSAVEGILGAHGCQPANRLPGDLGQYQQSHHCSLAAGVQLVFDLHWKISNTEIVSRFLEFDEMWERSILAARLGMRIPSYLDSLLLACVHRVAHHNRSRALLWLYDIHLLVASLAPDDAMLFQQRASDREVRELCRDGLSVTLEVFPSAATEVLLEGLSNAPSRVEKSQTLLGDHRSIDLLLMNFRSLDSFQDKTQWIREQLFPPVSYMRARYGQHRLPVYYWLYIRRILQSIGKFLGFGGR